MTLPNRKTGHIAYLTENRLRRRAQAVQRTLVRSARRRASERGLPFDLHEDDLTIPKVCPVLGIRIETPERRAGERLGPRDRSPSLDREVPEKGYVKENVNVISWRANKLKADASVGELRQIVKWMERSASAPNFS